MSAPYPNATKSSTEGTVSIDILIAAEDGETIAKVVEPWLRVCNRSFFVRDGWIIAILYHYFHTLLLSFYSLTFCPGVTGLFG